MFYVCVYNNAEIFKILTEHISASESLSSWTLSIVQNSKY
jgi:hypothetical protein